MTRSRRISSVSHPLVTVGALLVVAVAATAAVRAYVLNGYEWGPHQVPYYINPANLDVSEEAAEAAILSGADAWGTQSNADFQFYYAGRTSGSTVQNNRKNEVFFRNEPNGSYVGYTYWWYDGSGNLVDADIVLYDGSFTFFTGTSGCSGGVYLEDVATHEFGHALGLRHSDVSDATMVSGMGWCSQWKRTLAADDIAGVEAIYPPAGSPPSAPTNAAASTSKVSDPASQISVSWIDNSSNEDYFFVERSPDQANWVQFRVAADATSYTDTGLATDTTYYYRVRADNSAGSSAYSNTASATTAANATSTTPDDPSSPSPANGATGVNENSDLAWAGNAETYDVFFWPSAEKKPAAPYRSGLTSPFLALPRLSQNTNYSWEVVARSGSFQRTGATWTFTTRLKGRK